MHELEIGKRADSRLLKRVLSNNQRPAARPWDCLSVLRLPARLGTDETAALLGFSPHDIPTLIAAGLLQPLGKPVPNSPKFFAACVVEELRASPEWLDKATEAVSHHWREKNQRKSEAKSIERET